MQTALGNRLDPPDDRPLENPFTAPTADHGRFALPSERMPFDTYIYVAALFVAGTFATGFTMSLIVIPLAALKVHPAVGSLIVVGLALFGGYKSGSHMYHKLAKIQRAKVEWEMDQARRMGAFDCD